MNRLKRYRLTLVILGVLLVGGIGWLYGAGRLGGEHAELLDRRQTFVNAMQSVRTQRETRPEQDAREQALVARTLGGSLESVDSRLRERLYALGSVAGLVDLSVSTTGTASARRGTPARSMFSRRGNQRALRDEIDFVEVGATMSGVGSLEQVLRLVEWLQADGWIKRINQIQFNPDDNGERIRLTLRLVTIFLPGKAPQEAPGPGDPDLDRLAALIDPNPFRLPPPPAPEVPVAPAPKPVVQAPKPTPPERRFPYDKWVLTGVVIGPDGPEAWLRNPENDGRKVLRPGGTIGGAVLLRILGDEAVFELGEIAFEVRIGRSLQAGRDANQ